MSVSDSPSDVLHVLNSIGLVSCMHNSYTLQTAKHSTAKARDVHACIDPYSLCFIQQLSHGTMNITWASANNFVARWHANVKWACVCRALDTSAAAAVRLIRQYPLGRLFIFLYIVSIHLFIYVLISRLQGKALGHLNHAATTMEDLNSRM